MCRINILYWNRYICIFIYIVDNEEQFFKKGLYKLLYKLSSKYKYFIYISKYKYKYFELKKTLKNIFCFSFVKIY